MSFLNPLMLFGVAAVAVPIVIHLLNKRKFEHVVWAAMRFLKISVERNQRRLRIEDLLLLVVRCLLVGLLALTLARPAVRAASSLLGQAKLTAVIVIDNSYSMSQTDGVSSCFERAQKAAEQVLDALPSGSSSAVLLASDVAEGLVPEPTYDLNYARKMIREARLCDRATDLLPAVQRAMEILRRKADVRKDAYFITDGQLLGWKQFDTIRKVMEDARREDAPIGSHVIFVDGMSAERNLGVSALHLASGLAPVGRALRFEVQISNYGRSDAEDVRVSLRVDDEPPSDEATIEAIPAGESRSVSLFAKLRSEGGHTVTAQIGADHVPADDARTIAVRGIGQIKVLLVDGSPGREPRESEVFFLRHALVPVPPAEAGSYFIRTETVTPAELEGVRLDGYDAVVLADVTDLSPATVTAMASYLRRGGGVMIFPGANAQATFYNEQLFKQHAFLPAALGTPSGDAAQQEKFQTLQEKAFEHPIAAIWNDAAAGSPAGAHFYRLSELVAEGEEGTKARRHEGTKGDDDAPRGTGYQPVSLPPSPGTPGEGRGEGNPQSTIRNPQSGGAGAARVVLRYADGRPAVMERHWGQGRVVLFSSTASTKWNDLPVRPGVFVPLIYRTLGAIVQGQDEALNVQVGQKLLYPVSADLLGRDVAVGRPGEAKDASRDIGRVEMVGAQAALQYERTELAGAYEAVVAGETPVTVRFAAQADQAESSLDELPGSQRQVLATVADVMEWSPGASLERNIERQRVGTELWGTLAVVVLLLAVAETALAHWFSRPK